MTKSAVSYEFPADLATFTKEILSAKFHFLCRASHEQWLLKHHFSDTCRCAFKESSSSTAFFCPVFHSITLLLLFSQSQFNAYCLIWASKKLFSWVLGTKNVICSFNKLRPSYQRSFSSEIEWGPFKCLFWKANDSALN